MSSKPRPQSVDAEYKMVRSEIEQKISLHNSLLTFTITTTVAILAIAAGNANSNAFLYLLPFCVIIPMSIRIAYYRKAMAKLSSYLIVFCEPYDDSIKWETRNLSFFKQTNSNNRKFVLNYYECFILSIICYVLFLYNYLTPETNWDLNTIINCVWPIILIMGEYYITAQINRIDEERVSLIKTWESIKSKGDSSYSDYINYCDENAINPSPSFIQYKKGSGVYFADAEVGTKGIHRLSNSLDIFLIQAIVAFIYLFGQELATALFPNNGFMVSVVSLILYCIVLLVTAVLTRILIIPRKFGFNKDSYPILFQVHLLCIALFFLLWKQYNAFVLMFTLYIGFAFCQADVIKCKSASEIISHLLKPCQEAQLSFSDCIKFCLLDFFILSGTFWVPEKEHIVFIAIIAALVIYYAMDGIRKKCTKAFCCSAFSKTQTNSRCLVWNIGHENVVYHQLLNTMEIQTQEKTANTDELPAHFYDLIIVVNTLHTRESYIKYLDKIEKTLKPNGLIVDPSILNFTKSRSMFFSLLGIPNPFAKNYNLNQYKSIISDWK